VTYIGQNGYPDPVRPLNTVKKIIDDLSQITKIIPIITIKKIYRKFYFIPSSLIVAKYLFLFKLTKITYRKLVIREILSNFVFRGKNETRNLANYYFLRIAAKPAQNKATPPFAY
jgi:hypothetical protein